MTFHYVLQLNGEFKLGSSELLGLTSNSLAVMPPGLTHAIQYGTVEGQGDPAALLCELVAGSLGQLRLTVACGHVQVSYAGGTGPFCGRSA